MANPILNRTIYPLLKENLLKKHITVILGARQIGKTTLIKKIINDLIQEGTAEKNIFSITFDNPELRAKIIKNPNNLLREMEFSFGETLTNLSSKKYLFIDEAQKVPEAFDILKIIFDDYGEKIKIVLTGSSSLNLMKKSSETLAGRVSLFRLHSLSWREIISNFVKTPEASIIEKISSGETSFEELLSIYSDFTKQKEEASFDWKKYFLNGSLPEIFLTDNQKDRSKNFSDYIKTYLENDIKSLKQIGDENVFLDALNIFLLRDGQILNSSNLSSETGIQRLTLNKYLGVLKETFLINTLPPFVKPSRQSTKSSKTYFFDHGLSIYSKRIFSLEQLEASETAGAVFENIIVSNLIKHFSNDPEAPAINFWRDYQDHEIDLIISNEKNIIPIEICYSNKISSKKLNNFKTFYGLFPEAQNGFIVWNGDLKKLEISGKTLIAIPCWMWF